MLFMDRYISSTSIKAEQAQIIIITREISGEGERGIEWGKKYKRNFSCTCPVIFYF